MLVACLLMLVACGRSESARRERCHTLATSRNDMGTSRAEPGKVLLQLLRCDFDDTAVVSGVLREMSRVCGTNSRKLIETTHIDLEEMYPADAVARADEAGCGELRLRGQAIFTHPAVARALAELRSTLP